MRTTHRPPPGNSRTASQIRRCIEHGGERLWRFEDFRGLPPAAVAQTFSRLAKEGVIKRLSKGTYYRARSTVFGESIPNPTAIQELAARHTSLHPSGTTAANLLGFTTQASKRSELATSAGSLPRKLVGADTIVHTRRPEAWASLTSREAALLDFLRRGGATSEMSTGETIQRTLKLLAEKRCFDHLQRAAHSEPPKVRALLGALGEKLGKAPRTLAPLRSSLNPLSRYDFGVFAALSNARDWQAKKR